MKILFFKITALLVFQSYQCTSQSRIDSTHFASQNDSVKTQPQYSPHYILQKDSVDWFDYNSLGYALKYIPGVFIHELGSYGHPTAITFNHSLPIQSSIYRGSENISDLITGIPDQQLIAIEATDKVTVYPQHLGFYYGGNGKSFAVNVNEKEYDSPRPYSRIRHVEAPYDYLYTDVIFSVNADERSNFMAALTRQSLGASTTSLYGATTINTRLPNSGYESWNIRGAYRIKISEHQSLTFKDHYDHFILMFNGGINLFSTSILNADSAFGLIPSLVNTTMQRDIVRNRVEGNYQFHLFNDSAHTSNILLSFTSNVQTFLDRLDKSPDSLSRLNAKTVWDIADLSFNHSSRFRHLALEVSGALNRYQIRRSPYISGRSGFNSELRGKIGFSFDRFATEALGRLENKFGYTSFGFGITTKTLLTQNFSGFVGGSYSERSPSLFETSWKSSRVIRSGDSFTNEKILTAEIGFSFTSHLFESDLRVFYRSLHDPIEYGVNQVDINAQRFSTYIRANKTDFNFYKNDVGINLLSRLTLWKFFWESRVALVKTTSMLLTSAESFDPVLYGNTEVYFRDEIISGALDLKTGIRLDFSTSYSPFGYNPETNTFGFSSVGPPASSTSYSYSQYATVNLFVFAKVKTAILHFIWQNPLDYRYITTTFYPMYESGFRFGVSWSFLD